MKKKIIIIFLIMFSIIIVGLLLIKLTLNNYRNKEFNKFDYDNAKKITVKYLEKNEEQLKKISDELYESKELKEKPYEFIKNARYEYFTDFNFKENTEYIIFNMAAQGFLGGQYYGLIYSKKDDEELIIYNENERKTGNNIFIRQKIKDNWYFYYDDYDGKVNVDKIRKDKK